MAESQQKHRQSLEQRVVDSNCRDQRYGQVFGFIIAMTVVVGGFLLVREGKNVEGLVAIVASLVSLVGAFIYGKKKQDKDLRNKVGAFEQATRPSGKA
jgi:uncharacterized membrane protein